MKPRRDTTDEPATRAGEIAEFQGLYGTYHVTELLLQKMWLRGEFDVARAATTAGEQMRVVQPGRWNRLSGPDFQGAKLVLGDRTITGDVEVHFRAEAWTQHGHDRDPAYDDVVLHVVLFPPAPDAPPARTRSGREIPLLVLVDLLWHDLEEYASDEAVAALSGRDPLPIVVELLALGPRERATALQDAAERRWREKVHFAGVRVQRAGWEEACHLTTLEILGYRSNRAAMLRVGAHFPWRDWQAGDGPALEELLFTAAEGWSLRGVRPANHPRVRLAQYRAWMACVPDWPRRLRAWRLPAMPGSAGALDPAVLRRRLELPRVREAIAGGLCGGELGGPRFDTWICNLLLPFVAVAQPAAAEAAEILWNGWYAGDVPEALVEAARQLRRPGERAALANGLVQGLLGLQLARARGPVAR